MHWKAGRGAWNLAIRISVMLNFSMKWQTQLLDIARANITDGNADAVSCGLEGVDDVGFRMLAPFCMG